MFLLCENDYTKVLSTHQKLTFSISHLLCNELPGVPDEGGVLPAEAEVEVDPHQGGRRDGHLPGLRALDKNNMVFLPFHSKKG